MIFALCKLYFLFGTQEWNSAYFLKIDLYWVVYGDTLAGKSYVKIVLSGEVQSRIKILVCYEIVNYVDIIGLKIIIETVYLVYVKVKVFKNLVDFFGCEFTFLFAVFNKVGYHIFSVFRHF